MNRAIVVLGEASETDSEDEGQGKVVKLIIKNSLGDPSIIFQSTEFDGLANAVRGILVSGEDTESDNGEKQFFRK